MGTCTALSECTISQPMSSISFSAASRPRVPSMYARRFLSDHLKPCECEYPSEFFWIATFVRCTCRGRRRAALNELKRERDAEMKKADVQIVSRTFDGGQSSA